MTEARLELDPVGHHSSVAFRLEKAERDIGKLQEAVVQRDKAVELKDKLLAQQLIEIGEWKKKFHITTKEGVRHQQRADALRAELEEQSKKMKTRSAI